MRKSKERNSEVHTSTNDIDSTDVVRGKTRIFGALNIFSRSNKSNAAAAKPGRKVYRDTNMFNKVEEFHDQNGFIHYARDAAQNGGNDIELRRLHLLSERQRAHHKAYEHHMTQYWKRHKELASTLTPGLDDEDREVWFRAELKKLDEDPEYLMLQEIARQADAALSNTLNEPFDMPRPDPKKRRIL